LLFSPAVEHKVAIMKPCSWKFIWKSAIVLTLLNLTVRADQPGGVGAGKEFLLKYRLSVNIAREVGPGGQVLHVTPRPAFVQDEPSYRSREPLYATLFLGPKDERFTLVLDNSQGGDRGYDILYVDTARTGRIAAAEKFSSYLTNSGTLFGPVKFTLDYGTEKCPQWFFIRLSEQMEGRDRVAHNLLAINAGYYEGVVTFGEQKRRVALVDADGNGVYNDFIKAESQPADRIVISGDLADKRPARLQAQPLGRHLLVGDRYWRVDVAPDGSSLVVAPLNKPLGTIRATPADCTLLLNDEESLFRVQSAKGVARVPVGKYRLSECHYRLSDSTGRSWRFSSLTDSGAVLEVPANGEAKISLGPPLVPKVAVTVPEEGNLALTMGLTGTGGEIVNAVHLVSGKPPRPQARIRDANGRELGVVDFHFG
jgi:hypothetical protein